MKRTIQTPMAAGAHLWSD